MKYPIEMYYRHKLTKIFSKIIDMSTKVAYNINAGRNTLYTRVTELRFKRYVISSAARTPSGVFSFYWRIHYEYLCLFGRVWSSR